MAKLTRSQAKYIEEKFEETIRLRGKDLEKAYEKMYREKEKDLCVDFGKKYPEWKKHTEVYRAMAQAILHKELAASSSWGYANSKMRVFNIESRKLQEELHESLLFCDGTLETAQSIINNFTNKLKEIK